jgi:1-acyl-sn-glycerol-3-phosphate acyltransferase
VLANVPTVGSDVRPATTRKDRFITKLVSFLTRAVYRRIDVHWATEPPATGPLLSVSNHFGGFADALVLLYVLPRRPGIIARDVIWKVPVVGGLMKWIGALPVHKPEDGAGSSNDQMFSSCYEGLREGGHLLIFPEGVTRNEPSIARVKTGAARIVLGARASGAEGIVIQPVGIHYEDKAALRSRLVVQGGRQIDVDALAAAMETGGREVNADDRDAVDELTEKINVELRRAAPDYEDWAEANDLTSAAEITVRSQLDGRDTIVPIGLRDRLANALAELPADQRQDIRHALAEYEADLDGVGLNDSSFTRQLGVGGFLLRLIVQLVIGLLLLPFAIIGAVINVIPYLIVKAVGLLRVAPSMLSTVKPVIAFLAFGITWGIEIWLVASRWGLSGLAAAIVLIPVYSAAVLVVADRVVTSWRLLRRWRASRRSRGLDEELVAHRDAVVEAVLAA